MYISKKWIQDFVDIDRSLSIQDISNRLTLATTEIEGTKNFSEILANIIVGKITKKEKHPQADRLSICEVFDGKVKHQVICGASNVEQDMLIAYAPIGTKVKWHGKEEVILEKATIRGIESDGMICASVEIGLTDSFKEEDGILDITSTQAQPGTPLAQVMHLDDVVFELDNKSITHRPDLWGHYGMAREFSALYQKPLKPYPSFDPQIQKDTKYTLQIDIKDKKACPRYQGIVIHNVKVAPSPVWMQARLIACGMRPINNIVDITNYVMLELGQPLHAFDVDQIAKKEGQRRDVFIQIRKAKKGEILTTLDGNTHELFKEQLVITNESEILALAGIKGGLHSGITENTTSIMLESANFDAATIRKGSTIIGIRSEACARFEKTLDPNLTTIALQRACQLFQELIPGITFVTDVVDQNFTKQKQIVLKTDAKYFQQRIGMDIAQEDIVRILKSLGFIVTEQKNKLIVEVPSFRSTKDVLHEYDLVEEVVRIYGYDRINCALPELRMCKAQINEKREFEKLIKKILMGQGYSEVYNYSFTSETQQVPFQSDMTKYIEVADPFSSQVTHLRRDLMAGLLENVQTNEHSHDQIHLFEIGRVFLREEQSVYPLDDTDKGFVPKQPLMLGIVVSDKQEQTFYLLKGSLEILLETLHIPYRFFSSQMPASWSQMGASADILIDGNNVGEISKVKSGIVKQVGIKRNVYQASINIDELFDIYTKTKQKMIKMKKYPAVELDMAVIVDKYVLWQEMKEVIVVGEYIESVEVFDVYEGDQVEQGKKSIAFHIMYRSEEKTLTMEEANAFHQRILNTLKEKFQAQLRV